MWEMFCLRVSVYGIARKHFISSFFFFFVRRDCWISLDSNMSLAQFRIPQSQTQSSDHKQLGEGCAEGSKHIESELWEPGPHIYLKFYPHCLKIHVVPTAVNSGITAWRNLWCPMIDDLAWIIGDDCGSLVCSSPACCCCKRMRPQSGGGG